LESVQGAVSALGHERQGILTDIRKCDVQDSDQVSALWTRLDRYLHEDNIRPQLAISIHGLGGCRRAIEREAKGVLWRNRDKEAAVSAFSNTLNQLELMLQGLTSDFYPGGSGMGVQTLVPIYELLSKVRNDRKFLQSDASDVESLHEELGELARQALHDPSHEGWFRTAAKVEALVVELQLAFSVRVTE
jgi:hypothetical protein